MLRTTRQYPTLTPAPTRGPLPPMVGVVIPLARTNLVTNPSIELATTGWALTTGGVALARTATQQYHGTYSLSVQYGALGGGARFDLSLTSGSVYAWSLKLLDLIPNHEYKISIANGSGVDQASHLFRSTGRWQWVWVIHKATSTATHQLSINETTLSAAGTFYVDGAQLELISDGILAPTTYIDGDQLGLLVGQQPPAYLWTGTPHASTSTRSALTRAGGYVVNLSLYNFVLTGLIGLGMAAPNNVSIPYTVLDGARYQRTTKPPRTLTLTGRWQSDDPREQYAAASDMRQVFDRDLVPLQQPMVLTVEPQDECGNVIGDFAQVQCIYAGGLEGNDGNVPIEDIAPTFTMYVPYLIGGSGGAAPSVQQTVSNANYIAQRSPQGVWSALSTGVSAGASVYALRTAPSGILYAGGGFTAMSGVANTSRIAAWSGSAWSALGTGALNGFVYAFAVGADGKIYAAGSFTQMGGVANTARIAVWDGSSWAALGTGANGDVFALVAMPNGDIVAGGNFTLMGGVANTVRIARWNGSAWAPLSTGMNAQVLSLAVNRAGTLFAGGDFTTAGGTSANRIASWNGTAFSALSTGMNAGVLALVVGANNILYAGGDFTTAGGITAGLVAAWNGTGWASLGSGLSTPNSATSLSVRPDGVLVVGGTFTTAGGITLPDGIAFWNGSTWTYADVDLPSTAAVLALDVTPGGVLTVGFAQAGSATSAVITTVTNDTPGYVWPRLTINGSSSGTSRIYQCINYTTGFGIWFNLTLSPGEVATLNFDPQALSFTTTFQGDISSKVLPGSQPALMYLAPGANSISFFAASSTVTATLSWQKRYNGLADLVN